ncbi:MAG: penicillin acylase family protein [Planctomycetes bacterium]|nr:penicillin acylase family protein [Planctomycetota bacterium]
MNLSSKKILAGLGTGETIDSVCVRTGWSREQFDRWWAEECQRRVPAASGSTPVQGLRGPVRIRRDAWGIPHVEAEDDADLFFGFGYATAQDRLFQLDWTRRKASGRLAEVLGPEGVESDLLYRTLGLLQIAAMEWDSTPDGARALVAAYSAGVNAVIAASRDHPPIEFDLLDYRPESWSPVDCLAIAGEFRWYLTGRFPVLAIPELVKRALGDGSLYHAFLQGEADDESILPPDSYPLPTRPVRGTKPGEQGGADEGHGSNNWVLAASRTTTGQPIVASDPHVPFGAVSIWHEVHLRGGSFNVAGIAYAGVPGIMIGRNERVAWGVTNNICSLRDLYMEKTDPQHPGCFLYDGQWEPARERRELIRVRGAEPVVKTVRFSRNGPLVDDVLPGPARGQGPVALRWQGAEPCGWLTAMVEMNRARSTDELRLATVPWVVPTWNLVFADGEGHIGHQCVGRIPLRAVAERGYRPGWDPKHQWVGVIPFEGMPQQSDPKRGFVVTANNRLAGDDYPWPLSGTWSSAHRARRIRERIETVPRWSPEDCRRLQLDVRSGRAAACVPHLVELLAGDSDPRVARAVDLLRAWDYRMTTDSVAASLFTVFFPRWCRAVTGERLPPDVAEFAAVNAGGLATALLAGDEAGWYERSDRREAVRSTFRAVLDELAQKLGPDLGGWAWGRLHTLVQKHFLSGRGDLGQLLNCNGPSTSGDTTTVCSTTSGPDHTAQMGASYRMVADLADPHRGLWAVSIPGASGHPGSPHYGDQVAPWADGGCHYIPLDGGDANGPTLTLEPAS